MDKIDFGDFTNFSIDNIPTFLTDNKELLVNMNMLLDRHEISKSLCISLNRSIMGSKTKLSDVYDLMINNFEDISNKVVLIEKKIKEFNTSQDYKYIVDPANILYIIFFKQILYVKKLLSKLHEYIKSNINLVFIYSYLIFNLYDEPKKISSNYIFIINQMITNSSLISEYDERIKELLKIEIIDKIFLMIKIIYDSDPEFAKLLEDLKNQKMEECKKNNAIDLSDSFKEIENSVKGLKGGNVNIYELEEKFEKKRIYLLSQKRKIILTNLYSHDNINIILVQPLTIELWFGYNLFIYKRFNFDFKEYQTNINKILETNGFDQMYLLNLDYLNDIDAPDAGIIFPSLIGGLNNGKYYIKYCKYKNKYLILQKKLNLIKYN